MAFKIFGYLHNYSIATGSMFSFSETLYFILGNLIIEETSGRAGLKSDLSISCDSCDGSTSFQTSNNISSRGKSFDVNRRAVFHSLETGSGYEGLSSFCSIMNMPCLSKQAYYKQVETILDVLEKVTKEELISAGQKL